MFCTVCVSVCVFRCIPRWSEAFNIVLKSLQTHERAWNPFIYGHLGGRVCAQCERGNGNDDVKRLVAAAVVAKGR